MTLQAPPRPPGPRIGSLFSGYGGLDMAAEHLIGGTTAWVSDIDLGACRILAHRYPHAPNLGDITTVDWAQVEPVDILTGGFPCQDVSHAGSRAGLGPGTRSGLWSRMADAIDHLRPSLVIAENVRGLLSADAASDVEPCSWCLGDGAGEPALRALGAVLADLAELGYDASWYGLRAADVGAPHGRFRVFILAWPAADANRGTWGASEPEHLVPRRPSGGPSAEHGAGPPAVAHGLRSVRAGGPRGRWDGPADSRGPDAPDADLTGLEGAQPAGGRVLPAGGAPTHAEGDGRDEGRPEPAGLIGRPDAAVSGDAAPDARREHGERGPYAVRGGADPGRSSGEPQRLAEAVGDVRGTPLRPGVLASAPERMMGYSTHADPTEGRSCKALHGLRGEARAETVRESPGGSDSLPVAEDLRPVVREHEDRCDEGCAALAGAQASGGSLRGLRGDDGSARPPQGQEPGEQRLGEPADALLELSPQAALAGGQGEAPGVSIAWGPYEPAIRRWERVLGRLSPAPTEPGSKGQPRLSPRFVEFLMGLPAGWVTDVPGLSRNDQLKALGNGVVPQQAAAAVRFMLARLGEEWRWAA